MSNTPEEGWFYSHAGDRLGPVTYRELQKLAHQGKLNPRLDLVWNPSMSDWKPSGDVDGLFERVDASSPPAQAPALSGNLSAPGSSGELFTSMGGAGDWPGARRRSFLFMTVIFAVLWSVGVEFSKEFWADKFTAEQVQQVLLGLNIVPFVIGVYYGIQRLANVGMSRWWYLGNFVPILNVWIGYRSFACPAGYAVHRKLDGPGIFLAIIYWLVILLVVVSLALMVAVLMGNLGDPEMRRQMLEAMQQQLQEGKNSLPQVAPAP